MVDRAFGCPLDAEERASGPLAGGIVRNGYQCGMVWGATLAAGAEIHRRLGGGPRAEALAVGAAQRIVAAFRAQNGAVDCYDLTDTDFDSAAQRWKYLLTGEAVGCFRMAARFAPVAKAEIDAALAAEIPALPNGPGAPVSCAALLARRMGASDAHQVMAAGFAGGVGLCGGGCGALGAAVWLRSLRDTGGYSALEKAAGGTIDRFRAAARGRFECAELAGRTFESVRDHAAYLGEGGCAAVLDALAAG